MSRTEGQKISRQKYENKVYDQILIKVKKGKRDEYKAAAENLGLGQMELFRTAVEEYIANHGSKEVVPVKPASVQPSAEEKRLLQNLASLPKSTRAKFVSLLEEVAKLAEQKGADSNGDSGRTD